MTALVKVGTALRIPGKAMTALLCKSRRSYPAQGGTSPFHQLSVLKAARKFSPRTREPFCTDTPVGSVGTGGNQPVQSKVCTALVPSLVCREPLKFFGLLPHHIEIEDRSHTSRDGATPIKPGVDRVIDIHSYRWNKDCRGLFQLPVAA